MEQKRNSWGGYVVAWLFIAIFLSIIVQGLKYFVYLETAYHDQFYTILIIIAASATAIVAYYERRYGGAVKVPIERVALAPQPEAPNRYDRQMEALLTVQSITPVSLLSSTGEWECFFAAKNVLSSYKNYHVHAQACIGEYLKVSDSRSDIWYNAFKAINSKRVDFLICDNRSIPVLAIEYQGTGHDIGKDSDKRNAVKHLALQRAGIPVLEIFPEHNKADMEQLIKNYLS